MDGQADARTPEGARFEVGGRLPPLGRAARWAATRPAETEPYELWRLPAADGRVARRLLDLGRSGLGGFIAGSAEGPEPWMARAEGTSLAERMRARKGPWPAAEVLALGLQLARALSAAEAASLFPGPLTPEAVLLTSGGVVLPATALVSAMLGAPEAAARAGATPSPRWIPPEQAEGAPWDAAANRYALGLVLYRLLAGEHPFGGAGLRHALGDATHREAPPFTAEVAAALPPGLQSLVLRMLDPDRARRPARTAEITAELEALAAGARPDAGRDGRDPAAAPRREVTRPSGDAPSARAKSTSRTPPGRPLAPRDEPSVIGRYWPLALGGAIATAAAVLVARAPAARDEKGSARAAAVSPERPLADSQTRAADCAGCHPRQASEWRRSVMAHSVKSPLFNGLESLIEEQVGRQNDCPGGAGILRRVNEATACRSGGNAVTGSGGEHWCVNCHSPTEKLEGPLPPWDGRIGGDARTRRPVRDLLGERGLEGISCAFCHEVHGPVPGRGQARGAYEGNATWTSFVTGATFAARPEDGRGLTGIGNSGYDLRPADFLSRGLAADRDRELGAHLRPPRETTAYLRTSEFCGSCHDVRLFGTDTLAASKGEHFKRLRNAYSEWAAWAKTEERAGRQPATCQGCHMSQFPGVCSKVAGASGTAAGEGEGGCPPGFRFEPKAPGAFPEGHVAEGGGAPVEVTTHYFSGVDVPLSRELSDELADEPTVDLHGLPLSARRRRDLLLRHTFRFGLGAARRGGKGLEIPVEVENVGAGHRVPAGFSQEREFWVSLVVRDGSGRVLYEVGRVDRNDEDLRDKVFTRVNTTDDDLDRQGRPRGLFGADVRDGPDVPEWSPPPALGGASFRGRGLINFQNGFLRCVRCIGTVTADGRCDALPGQDAHRAARFADGDYDLDTGECRSNLSGPSALFETYFPVGALDSTRGFVKGPDAIVDTRSLPPGVPVRYTYDLATEGRRGPFRVEARLLFRAFPPFLVKAFAGYERAQARRGLRPNGPNVTEDHLRRLEVVELAETSLEIP